MDTVFSSIEFSPNSRFVYISASTKLYQVDTWEENLSDGTVLIDTWNGVLDPFPIIFFLAQLAPDCKIYICSTSSTNSYHVINKPDEKGLACDFVQQGIQLPHVSSVGNFPNFPRFRVDEKSPCDPNITSIFGENAFYLRELEIFPNPATDMININIPENQSGQILLFDQRGQLIEEVKLSSLSSNFSFNISALISGSYFIEFIPGNNVNRMIYTAKFFKISN